MFLGVGTGAYVAGVFHLATHAFFKALLFLGAGSVIHAMHHAYHATHSHEDAQDMRNMGGLRQYMPVTFALMLHRDAGDRGHPAVLRVLLQGRDPGGRLRPGRDQPIYYVFYGMGVLAALLTAFYMARLMAMTFLGGNRTGERERAPSARGALDHDGAAAWCSGVLSAVGGVLNLPHLVGRARGARALARAGDGARARSSSALVMPHGLDRVSRWWAPRSPSACSDCSWASARPLDRPTPTAQARRPKPGFALVLNRKYYVDELYDALIVRPVAWLSRVVLWRGVDQGLVDGVAVNGTRLALARLWAGGQPLLQTGQVGVYVVLFLVGAIWILRAVIR